MEYYGMSEKGERDTNEDSYIAEKVGDFFVCAIADGVGGHIWGDLASRMAIGELREAVGKKAMKGLFEGFVNSNETLFFENKRKNWDMATTMVASLIQGNYNCFIGNVGDSRAYIISDGIWRTKDQSVVENLHDAGIISEAESFSHPKRNVITQGLGLDKKVKVDVYKKNVADSVLLLCSDGLSDYVTDNAIAEIVRKYNAREACQKLIKKALQNGSRDNITVIIARFDK